MSLWYLSHTLVTQNTHRKLWILSEPLNHTNQRLLSHMNTDTILQYKYVHTDYTQQHSRKTQKSRLCWYKPPHYDKILKKVQWINLHEITSRIFNSEEVRKFWSSTFCRILSVCGALAFHDLHLMPFLLSFFCSWPHKWMRSLRNSSQPVKSWRSFPQLENGRNWIMRPESFNASSKSTLRKLTFGYPLKLITGFLTPLFLILI